MFLALFVCQFVLAAANPFHKYPYVFLLDVGNEELEKTNTEQIRLSIPGGSLALRYPAIGEGDTIAHVRVSGIDFGTELKANILDGGPGYKYVVLVFMGNRGVPYDAVMTIQTVSESDIIDNNQSNENESKTSSNDANGDNSNDIDKANNSAEVTDDDTTSEKGQVSNNIDANDSSEDTSDDTDTQNGVNGNAEVSQESSNVYSYAQNEVQGTGDDDDDESEDDDENESGGDDLSNQNGINMQHSESKQAVEYKDYQKYSDMSYEYNSDQNAPEQSDDNEINLDTDDDKAAMDNNIYQSYAMIRPAFYDGVRFYPQNSVPFLARGNVGAYNPENSLEFDTANDEDDHSQVDKYRDSNNNYFESDDGTAVVS